jgi:hypothetical protein
MIIVRIKIIWLMDVIGQSRDEVLVNKVLAIRHLFTVQDGVKESDPALKNTITR